MALLLRLAFDPLWDDRLAYAWFFLGVVAVARFAGTGPQLAAIAGGFLLANWFFVQPRGTLLIGSRLDQVNTLIYFAVCGLIVFSSSRARWHVKRELAARDRIAGLLECTTDAVCTVDANWEVTFFNGRATEVTGLTRERVLGRELWNIWPEAKGTEIEAEYRRALRVNTTVHLENYFPQNDRWIEIHACPYGDGLAVFFRDVSEKKRADLLRAQQELEKEKLIAELKAALAEVKTLSGLLPICAQCKKVRDDKGYWNQIEIFISARSHAKFSHGVCPDCMVRLYPDLQ